MYSACTQIVHSADSQCHTVVFILKLIQGCVRLLSKLSLVSNRSLLCWIAQLGDVSSKHLMEMVTSSNLNSVEIQALIDVLLNKQGDNSQWKKV